jgi:hypothetical protein
VSAAVVVRQVFHSGFWRTVAVLWAAFVVFNVWDVGRRGWPHSGVVALLVVGAITVVVYAIGWRPAVVADANGMEVRNPLRTIHLPWNAITDIDATDALRVHVGDQIFRAWAVGRGGAAASALRGMGRKPTGAPGIEANALRELARQSPADYAAATLTDLWRQTRNRTTGNLRITWAWPEAAVLVVLVLAAVAVAQ